MKIVEKACMAEVEARIAEITEAAGTDSAGQTAVLAVATAVLLRRAEETGTPIADVLGKFNATAIRAAVDQVTDAGRIGGTA